jgi:hypothetical protein
MIFMKSLRLENFKGIEQLSCDFDDLTLLAGLNNSGKTSVLQATYLVASTVQGLHFHSDLFSENRNSRVVDLNSPATKLGLPSFEWLLRAAGGDFKLSATFWNDCTVVIEMLGRGRFIFDVSTGERPEGDFPDEKLPEDASAEEKERLIQEYAARARQRQEDRKNRTRAKLRELGSLTAEFFRPPGMLPARELMLNHDQYRNYVATGQGGTYWRNAIWWGIQNGGTESFEPVRRLVREHFPDVEVRNPRLGLDGGQPPIIIEYKEADDQFRDIAQSGSGLHTFLSLAQAVKQSHAGLVLLDEPDSHLHGSQQALVVTLLAEIAAKPDRQVVIATHSAEVISRVQRESIRWLSRDKPVAEGGLEKSLLLDRLGASPDVYMSKSDFPKVIVYVEGDTDKPILEGLIDWCLAKDSSLPKPLVVRHKDGKFNAVALQAIYRTADEQDLETRVVGIRDLDWDYRECDVLPPSADADIRTGTGYTLVTLMCKELENLLCDADLIVQALSTPVARDEIERMIVEESENKTLIDDLRHHAEPQIRGRFSAKEAEHTKEKKSEEEFEQWRSTPSIRRRLIDGGSLLSRIRERLYREQKARIAFPGIFSRVATLPPQWQQIAQAIFPDLGTVIQKCGMNFPARQAR